MPCIRAMYIWRELIHHNSTSNLWIILTRMRCCCDWMGCAPATRRRCRCDQPREEVQVSLRSYSACADDTGPEERMVTTLVTTIQGKEQHVIYLLHKQSVLPGSLKTTCTQIHKWVESYFFFSGKIYCWRFIIESFILGNHSWQEHLCPSSKSCY